MRDRIDSVVSHNRNPFISALSFLDTDELLHLNRILSGGKWLAEVRRQLNLRAGEYSYIAPRLSGFERTVVYGRR